MNERIRELIQSQNDNRGVLWTEEDKEEFAELLIRKCVEVVKWTPSHFPNDEYVKNIKEHFGIE